MKDIRVRLWLGFVIALILSILPMPEMVSTFRPPWVLLFVLYIEYFLPGNFKLTTLLLLGLSLDVLLSTVIGEHSFVLLLVTWIASGKSRRFQFFSMTQQLVMVGFFCLVYQSVISFIDAMLGFSYSMQMPVVSAMSGMLLWPWIRIIGESTLLKRVVYPHQRF